MKESWCIHRPISWFLILSVLALLACCRPATEDLSTVTPISPRVLPYFLEEVYPDQGSIVSTDDYTGKVCVQLDACDLVLEGDIWDFDEVITRTAILVDDQPTGELLEAYAYLVGCATTDEQGNILSRAGGPYNWCVCAAPIATGLHRADMSFERSNDEVLSFAWTFELVSGPVPTPTPLPGAVEVDRIGHLPDYVQAVYPSPGEEIRTSPSGGEWQEVLDDMGMPDMVQPTSPNRIPVCFALAYHEVLELGALPAQYNFLDRIYFTVEGIALGESLYSSPYNRSLGMETSPQCFEIPLIPGEYVATAYVDPYDTDLAFYSWAFTIADE